MMDPVRNSRVSGPEGTHDEVASAISNGMDLIGKKCVACEGGVFPLSGAALEPYLEAVNGPDASPAPTGASEVGVKWEVVENKKIRKEFTFPDFKSALAFVNKVGDIAESEGHHPDIQLGWGRVGIELWTHAINGLSENDFIVAAKIDQFAH